MRFGDLQKKSEKMLTFSPNLIQKTSLEDLILQTNDFFSESTNTACLLPAKETKSRILTNCAQLFSL